MLSKSSTSKLKKETYVEILFGSLPNNVEELFEKIKYKVLKLKLRHYKCLH